MKTVAHSLLNLERIVVIDAAWTKSAELAAHESLASLPRVSLSPHCRSRFWRYAPERGDNSMFNKDAVRSFLSTVEAIHQCVNDYESDDVSLHKYDDLLWLFEFQRTRVKKVYDENPGKRSRILRKSKGLLSSF